MTDTNGATSTTTLDITIIGTNDQPIALADDDSGDAVTEAGVDPGNDRVRRRSLAPAATCSTTTPTSMTADTQP